VVFVGPTLPLDAAVAVLPDALYLPPARCGDVLQALRLSPRALLIIDGTYERTPAVWHKEIAVALEQNIPVFGAASMGALRAAELASFGMIGIGGIFEDYRDGRLMDDDEVAVIHSASGEPLSTAMVDIRATVERAVDEGELSHAWAERILGVAKQTFYPERSLEAVLERLDDCAELRRFAQWLARGGKVHRKRNDAELALRIFGDGERHVIPVPPSPVPRTVALRVLFRHVTSSAFRGENSALPEVERVVQAARFLGRPYRDAKRLAELTSALWELAPPAAEGGADELWGSDMESAAWPGQNGCTPSEQRALRERMASIAELERDLLRPPDDPAARLAWRVATRESRYLRWLDALDEGVDSSSDPEPVRRMLARAWRAVDLMGRRARLIPQPALLRTLFDEIRILRGLIEPEHVDRWLASHRLSRDELGALLLARFRWHIIASETQSASLGATRSDETIHWLRDALRLTGLYPRAKALLRLDAAKRLDAAVFPASLAEALERDFDDDDPGAARRILLRA
jgi:hypothetical protein